jgi:hypothetical protein
MSRRLALVVLVIPLVALVIGIALPMYTCMDPYEFEEIRGPGAGPLCIVSDMGYRPTSWLQTKITIAAAGVVLGIAVLLIARRQHLVAIGLLIAFAAIAVPWFVPDGWEPRIFEGREVAGGHEINRGALRTGIVVVGVSIGVVLAVVGVARSHRSQETPSGVT